MMFKIQSKKLDLPQRIASGSGTQGSSRSADFASALQNARTAGWDPHEVWLTRVKQPRDRRGAG